MEREESPRIDVEAYYRRFGPMVWRRCLRMLRNEEAALDTLQEVFVRLMIYRDRLKGMSPSSLLYRMATNLCLNKIRDQRRQGIRESLDLDDGRFSGSPQEQGLDLQMALEAILEEEEESTRQMAFLYFMDGLNLKEVSVEMDMSVAGVHRRLKNLRRRLKRLKQ